MNQGGRNRAQEKKGERERGGGKGKGKKKKEPTSTSKHQIQHSTRRVFINCHIDLYIMMVVGGKQQPTDRGTGRARTSQLLVIIGFVPLFFFFFFSSFFFFESGN